MEKVSDAQYRARTCQEASAAPAPGRPAGTQPTPAQQLIREIAPKLAELTDYVLFGDVWVRPGLSGRGDRSSSRQGGCSGALMPESRHGSQTSNNAGIR